ncbi:T9SS type A sorting domain-containing protein [candidate division KSB1 bacterium]|nr:T9SS type A sorting domain-containing protein [candidate division KSB1 bacterium]
MKNVDPFLKLAVLSLVMIYISYTPAFADGLSVKLASPANKAHFDICSDITLTADAGVQQGEIKRVEFYRNGFLLRSDTKAPFEYLWTDVPTGLYELTAKVIDDSDNELLSEPKFIYVGNAEDGNLVTNGEFTCREWPWRLDQYEGAKAFFDIYPDAWLTEDSSGAYIEIQEIGSQVWGVQLMQQFQIKAGHTYEVSFYAVADQPKDIQVTFSMDYEPWDTHWYQDITVSDLQEYGPYTFECTIDDPKVMFKFILGGNLTAIFIDAVKIIDKQWTLVDNNDSRTVKQYELFQNYPNPFNPDTRIKYSIGKPGNVKLSIYNILGESVYSCTEAKSAGTFEFNWDGRDNQGRAVNSGVYFYKLESGEFSSTRKMLMLK